MNNLNKRWITCYAILFYGIIMIASCKEQEDQLLPINDLSSMPYNSLSEYGLFTGTLNELIPVDETLPYDLNVPLFSDYAQKSRFIYLPPNQKIKYNKDEIIDFPTGTIIVKTFYFLADINDQNSEKRIIETRLLVKYENEWLAWDYVWNEAQTEATYTITSKVVNVNWLHYDGSMVSTNYVIPNQNECKTCHSVDSVMIPIGPKGRNMDLIKTYSDGTTMNQLDKIAEKNWWTSDGYNKDGDFPNWQDNIADVDKKARAYLDINCAHCHNPHANANNSGLFLHYTNTDSSSLGICKPPVAAGGGTGGFQYAIVPGHPESSIMVNRLNSLEPDVMMPEIGRSQLHQEGIELIRNWILGLPESNCN